MEFWELNLLHDGDIKRICICSDEQPLFEMAIDMAFNLFAEINEWPLKQEHCHASVSVNDKLHSILVKISTQDDNTVELWEYKLECIYKEPCEDEPNNTLLQEVVSCVRDIPKLFYDWAENFCWKARKNGYLQ
jgi:hypothetical protein